jgi:glutamate-1-semialdehyde aminotransferase
MRIVQNGAAAMKINIAANAFEAQVGADVVVLGGVATGGMAKAATIAKADVADMGAIEVPDGTDLSATGQNLSIYATVVGRV